MHMYNIRIFREEDSLRVLEFISEIIVNEFNFDLELQAGGLDSDLLHIEEHYNKSGGCFWIAEENDRSKKLIGTVGIRKLTEFHDQATCELKRMYVSKLYRRLGIGQKMLNEAIKFAIEAGYMKMVLDSSRRLTAARSLYVKNGFIDSERYNDNHRADVFMRKVLVQ